MTTKDKFGDRMKMYEQVEAGRKLMPLLPICVRLDGKGFSKYTKHLEKPYDINFCAIMIEVTKHLVEYSSACIGYTQSDEISLIFYSKNIENSVFFDGKIQKMTSVLASVATAVFNKLANERLPKESIKEYAFFDCRAWNVPNKIEACNVLLWREYDATKNSITSACASLYSHHEIMNKHSGQKLDMLLEKGVNWNQYPNFFKRGSYVQRKEVTRLLTDVELATIPLQYQPKTPIIRSDVVVLDMPIFSKVTNKEAVIFDKAKPIVLIEADSV